MATSIAVIVLFVAMLAVAAQGWRSIPARGRFRARAGLGSDGTMSKKTGLFMWPAMGSVTMLGTITTSIGWLGVGLMVWLLFMEFVSVSTTAGGPHGEE